MVSGRYYLLLAEQFALRGGRLGHALGLLVSRQLVIPLYVGVGPVEQLLVLMELVLQQRSTKRLLDLALAGV